jgi:hypothetical protein
MSRSFNVGTRIREFSNSIEESLKMKALNIQPFSMAMDKATDVE